MKQRHLAHATVLGAGQAHPGRLPPANCWLACPAAGLPLWPAAARSKVQLRLPAGVAPDLVQQGPAWHCCPEPFAASCLWPSCGSSKIHLRSAMPSRHLPLFCNSLQNRLFSCCSGVGETRLVVRSAKVCWRCICCASCKQSLCQVAQRTVDWPYPNQD